jgi:hypothetical protein
VFDHRALYMKCRPEDMQLFDLDYGDLIRPPFRILRADAPGPSARTGPKSIWSFTARRMNGSGRIFDTSPYVLPPGATTPDSWDCKGFLLPSDRILQRCRRPRYGPLAIKFWNFRHFWVKSLDAMLTSTAALGTMASLSRARSTGPSPTFPIRTFWAA